MRKIRKYWRKWYVQMIIILVPFTLGLIGYWMKYAEMSAGKEPIMKDMVLYSTIRLFGFMFDGDKNGIGTSDKILAVARWLAVIPTGSALHKLLSPLTARFFSEIGFRFWNRSGNRLLVFGANDESRHMVDTAAEYHPMIRCETDEDFRLLRRDGYRCVQMTQEAVMSAAIAKAFSTEGKQCRIVIHEQNDEINLNLCRIAVQEIRKELAASVSLLETLKKKEATRRNEVCALEKKIIHKLEKLRIVVYGDKNLESAYLDLVKQSYGVMKYTNKYRIIAMGLIEKYPLIRFMDREKHVNDKGLVADDVKLNVIMIGFGDTNQELFTSSMNVNQFVTGKENEIPRLKTVDYYIYDKEPVETNKNLNHMAFRFENEFMGAIRAGMIQEDDYLTLPQDPANNQFDQTDINDQKFYEQLWRIMTTNKNSVNVISIAHGSDLENIDLAQKLRAKVREWNISNIHLFVKIRKTANESFLNTAASDDLIIFGNEIETFGMQTAFNDELEEMTQKKHCLNALVRSRGKCGTDEDSKIIELHSMYEWYAYDPMRKKSSIYSILSIRSKLLLMGLDYRKKEENTAYLRNNNEYFEIYAKNDRPVIARAPKSENEKAIYDYQKRMEKSDFREQTLRKNLAVQEHYRWNAFMISNGFVPATKQKILAGNTKDYDLRTHGNLTTFEGLFDYRELLEKANAKPETIRDVISYDFHLMDDAWWYLNQFGYEVFAV